MLDRPVNEEGGRVFVGRRWASTIYGHQSEAIQLLRLTVRPLMLDNHVKLAPQLLKQLQLLLT